MAKPKGDNMAKPTGDEPHAASTVSDSPESTFPGCMAPKWWIDCNLNTLGCAPAMAMAYTYLTMADSTGRMFHNAGNAQHNLDVVAQAATVRGVKTLLRDDPLVKLMARLEIKENELLIKIAYEQIAAEKSAKPGHGETPNEQEHHAGI